MSTTPPRSPWRSTVSIVRATARRIERAGEWIIGMQSRNGGWGSFDADNTHYYLNHIPFADHGALLDPPTADVSARCLGFLAQLGYGADHPAVAAAIAFLRREQEADGSWFGRWGTNYIYGTWSVLAALNAAGIDPQRRKSAAPSAGCSPASAPTAVGASARQSYWPGMPRGEAPYSTPSQTAWALLGLMAAGEADNPAVARGIAYSDRDPGLGAETGTSPGLPQSAFRGCFSCAITATGPISRSGHWPVTAV